jgi:hypothetical protein
MALIVTLQPNGSKGTFDTNTLAGGTKWLDYATGFLEGTEPIQLTTISTGDVWSYNYGANTYFRLVPSGALADAFYSTFTSGVLSGLLAKKPQVL